MNVRILMPKWWEGGFCPISLLRLAMGDSLINFSKLTDIESVGIIKSASSELQRRLEQTSPVSPRAFSSTSFERVDFTPSEPSDSGVCGQQALKEPWTCGYHCRWCKAACTRQKGHVHHSCFEHRHR